MLFRFTSPFWYKENRLVLVVQSPRTLYVYWELSPNQRAALGKNSKLQMRLNAVNGGLHSEYEINKFWDSFYFTGVQPCCSYRCDIGITDPECNYYPLIYSNKILTPAEGPSDRHIAGSSDFLGYRKVLKS